MAQINKELLGKEIFFGKEPGNGRLMVMVDNNGNKRIGFIGMPGDVPNSVTRCRPQETKAHGKLVVDSSGNIRVVNLKAENITRVNGTEIETKRVATDSVLELGLDRYPVSVDKILSCAYQALLATPTQQTQKSVPPQPPIPQTPSKPNTPVGQSAANTRIFNISHLEIVWNRYHDGLMQIQERQKKINLIRSGCGLFTVLTVPCSLIMGPLAYIFTGIGVIGNIYSFIGLKNDSSTQERERLTEEFQDHYCCPNPECNRFMGMQSYKLLKKQTGMKCPHCKSSYVEK